MAEEVGRRIAMQRRRRGLSQAALAGLVGRSESWLSQVERGCRGVDSYTALRDLARVLRVDIALLAEGRSDATVGRPDPTEERVTAIERALLGDTVHGGGIDLVDQVSELHADYQAARYDTVLDALPGLVAQLFPAVPDPLIVSGYTVAAKMLNKIGAVDLALLAADRAWTAARRSADPADVAMAVHQVTCSLLPTIRAGLGEDLAVRTAHDAEAGTDPAVLSTTGALWLVAAVAAARRQDEPTAEARLDRADRLAARLGADGNHRWTAFGPTNVAIHRVSIAVDLGDAGTALRAAAAVDPERLPESLRSRQVQVGVDIAWAQAQRRRDAEALVALLDVERHAPQVTRANAVARDTIRQLLGRARGTTGASVRALADRAGITGT